MENEGLGPATPGTAARCEHADVVSTGRDASGVEWGRCNGCGDSTFVIDDPTPNPDGIRCGTFQPKPPGWEHPHMIEPEGGWPEGSGFLSCAPEDCPTCLKRKVAGLDFYKKTVSRLKAENASLLESLRAAQHELGFKRATDESALSAWTEVDSLRAALGAAEQRAEAAEKERDEARAAEAELRHLVDVNGDHWRAAEKRAADLMGALRAAADALNALQSTACRCLGEAYNPPEHLPTCPWWKVAAAEAHARRVLAALHDEERPDVAQQVAHAEALVAQAGRSLKALEEKTGVTMHDEERSAPPPSRAEPRAAAPEAVEKLLTDCDAAAAQGEEK